MLAGRRPGDQARRDDRPGRPQRRRQEHAGQPGLPVLRRERGGDPGRRRRPPLGSRSRRIGGTSAWSSRSRSCSSARIAENIAYGRPEATPRRDHRGGPGRAGPTSSSSSWPTATTRSSASAASRSRAASGSGSRWPGALLIDPKNPDPRRGDLFGRHRDRTRDPGGARQPGPGPDDDRRGPPAQHAPQGRPPGRPGERPDRRGRARTRNCSTARGPISDSTEPRPRWRRSSPYEHLDPRSRRLGPAGPARRVRPDATSESSPSGPSRSPTRRRWISLCDRRRSRNLIQVESLDDLPPRPVRLCSTNSPVASSSRSSGGSSGSRPRPSPPRWEVETDRGPTDVHPRRRGERPPPRPRPSPDRRRPGDSLPHRRIRRSLDCPQPADLGQCYLCSRTYSEIIR